MKKILFLFAVAATLMACNDDNNNLESPETQVVFSQAVHFEASGTNSVPSESYTQDSVRAVAFINDDTVTIELYGVSFSSRMPVTIYMVISGASFSRTTDKITFSGENIVPTMGGKPFERYAVTALSGFISADSLVFTNNYGSYENCRYAGEITKMSDTL